jgi:hypothetical protein
MTDPGLPDLPDVPEDIPPGGDPGSVPDSPPDEPEPRDTDHPTGEAQAQENRERESPA